MDKRKNLQGLLWKVIMWMLHRWSCPSGERTGCDIDENELLKESTLGCKVYTAIEINIGIGLINLYGQ